MTLLEIVTLEARPDVARRLLPLPSTWPTFLTADLSAKTHFRHVARGFPHLCVVAFSSRQQVIARVRVVSLDLSASNRGGMLPDGGWSAAISWAMEDHADQRVGDTACVLEVDISASHRTPEVREHVLRAIMDAARAAGCSRLVFPLRPLGKHLQPRVSMSEYVAQTGDDDLPIDPILKFHASMGGRIAGIAPASLVVAAGLDQWRDWTDLPFKDSGMITVPEALGPVWCSQSDGYAVYVEPNVWVEYALS